MISPTLILQSKRHKSQEVVDAVLESMLTIANAGAGASALRAAAAAAAGATPPAPAPAASGVGWQPSAQSLVEALCDLGATSDSLRLSFLGSKLSGKGALGTNIPISPRKGSRPTDNAGGGGSAGADSDCSREARLEAMFKALALCAAPFKPRAASITTITGTTLATEPAPATASNSTAESKGKSKGKGKQSAAAATAAAAVAAVAASASMKDTDTLVKVCLHVCSQMSADATLQAVWYSVRRCVSALLEGISDSQWPSYSRWLTMYFSEYSASTPHTRVLMIKSLPLGGRAQGVKYRSLIKLVAELARMASTDSGDTTPLKGQSDAEDDGDGDGDSDGDADAAMDGGGGDGDNASVSPGAFAPLKRTISARTETEPVAAHAVVPVTKGELLHNLCVAVKSLSKKVPKRPEPFIRCIVETAAVAIDHCIGTILQNKPATGRRPTESMAALASTVNRWTSKISDKDKGGGFSVACARQKDIVREVYVMRLGVGGPSCLKRYFRTLRRRRYSSASTKLHPLSFVVALSAIQLILMRTILMTPYYAFYRHRRLTILSGGALIGGSNSSGGGKAAKRASQEATPQQGMLSFASGSKQLQTSGSA